MTTSTQSHFLQLVVVVALALTVGCDKAANQPSASVAEPSPKSEVTPIQKTSFADVTSHLDAGGNLYLYLGTEEWLKGLSSKVAQFKSVFTNLPELGPEEQAGITTGFDVLGRLIRSSGLEEISGFGLSGIMRENDLYRTRMVVHHYPGADKGFLWSLCGSAPHALETVDFLPATTAVAVSSDFNLAMLWNIVETEVKATGIAEAEQGLAELRKMMQAQFKVELPQLLQSVPGPFLVALLLDETRTFSIPVDEVSIKIPEPGLVIMAKVKDETLYGLVEKSLPPDAPMVKTNQGALKMVSMPLPLGLPFAPTMGQAGEYFFLASHGRHIETFLAVKDGKGSPLKNTPEFARLAKGIELKGNQFSFVSERLGKAVNEAMTAALSGATNQAGMPPMELMQSFMGAQKVTLAVGSSTPQGWVLTANGNQHPGALAAAPLVVAPTAVLASLLLPALSKAKDRAQSVSCTSNMKQISLAALIYANDHDEMFPASFLTMSNELHTPKVLVCPSDRARKAPTLPDWGAFDTNNVSYEFLLPGVKNATGDRILLRCPIHGHVAMSDGSVRMGPRPE